jgi:hypothetical protein
MSLSACGARRGRKLLGPYKKSQSQGMGLWPNEREIMSSDVGVHIGPLLQIGESGQATFRYSHGDV